MHAVLKVPHCRTKGVFPELIASAQVFTSNGDHVFEDFSYKVRDPKVKPDVLSNEMIRLNGEGSFINIISKTFNTNSSVGSKHDSKINFNIEVGKYFENCKISVLQDKNEPLPICGYYD